MSSSRQSQFRDGKTSTPNTVHPSPGGPHHNRYSLNLKVEPSPSSYRVPKPKKIGRLQLWIQRNPRRFHVLAVTIGVSIFFSRPLYDIFIRTPLEGPRSKGRNQL